MDVEDPILLQYVAGEMPAADQAAFEERITREPALRAAAERLRQLDADVRSLLSDPSPATDVTAGVRGIARAMTRARADAAAKVPEAATAGPRGSLLPRWAYPLTAAAVIIVGLISLVEWSSNMGRPATISADGTIHREGDGENDEGGPNGNDGRPNGQGGRPPVYRFRAGVFAMEDADLDTLSISAGSYDVSSMFKTDVD